MVKWIVYIVGFVGLIAISSCLDVEEEDSHHAYYTLINKSDYDIKLKYADRYYSYSNPIRYDTVIKRDSSYLMEVIWDIMPPPFHDVDTLQVSFGSELVIEDHAHPMRFKMIRFTNSANYELTEETQYIRHATYTITNADYEYAKQKLAEREIEKAD